MKEGLQAQLARRIDKIPDGPLRQQQFVRKEDDVPRALNPQPQFQEVPSGVVGQGLASQRLERGNQLPEVGGAQGTSTGGDGAESPDDSPELRGKADLH